jgi:hypothetical protein
LHGGRHNGLARTASSWNTEMTDRQTSLETIQEYAEALSSLCSMRAGNEVTDRLHLASRFFKRAADAIEMHAILNGDGEDGETG